MRQRHLSVLLVAALAACSGKTETAPGLLPAPTGLSAEQLSPTSVRFTWQDNCGTEQGYYLFLRGSGQSPYTKPSVVLGPDSSSHVFEDLEQGRDYWFGVQAYGADNAMSPLVYTDLFYVKTLGEFNYVDDGAPKVGSPAYVDAEQTAPGTVRLTWPATADAAGYRIYLREGQDDLFRDSPGETESGVTQFLVEGLTTDATYVFGVQALGQRVEANAPIVESAAVEVADLSGAPTFNLRGIDATSAYITVSYKLEGISVADPEHGICLSTEQVPTVDDLVFPGPQGKDVLQVLSAAALDPGTEYRLRIYARVGGKVWYSPMQHVALAEAPTPLTFHWAEVTGLSLPEAVKVYRTTDKLEGRNFNAWYAIADCTGPDVEFRVLNPDGKYTIDQQAAAAGDCYVLINGGIYGTKHIGPVIADGVLSAWRDEADAQYWGADGKLHYVTRSMFGVDADGHPATCYSFYAAQGDIRYYDRPIPSVSGEARYGAGSDTFPGPMTAWQPRQAITTGPLVLHRGNISVDLGKSASGAWLSNFELWADDIFATHPDRTCVGYTEDGKIVLFVCDGRIADSDGAYLSEVGRIMKGLGCVGALNLDGGGSTGMWAGGRHLNSLLTGSTDPQNPDAEYNRPVMTTLGFFKKR